MKKMKKIEAKEIKADIHPDFWFLVIGILVLGAIVGYAIGSYSGGAATGKAYTTGETYCYETDGGDRPLLKGSAWGKLNGTKYNNTDRCNSPTRQREYYCVGSLKKDKYYNCNCVDGACVQAPPNCTDTDGGYRIYTKGRVYGTNESGNYSMWDSCGGHLHEMVCVNGQPRTNVTTCPDDFYCSDGACVENQTEMSCTDTDGGYNLLLKGRIYGVNETGNYSSWDNCAPGLGSQWIAEKYCLGSRNAQNITTCPTGYNCTDGACLTS